MRAHRFKRSQLLAGLIVTIIVVICFVIIAIYASPAFSETRRSSESSQSWTPQLSLFAKTGMGAYRPASCRCFDRTIWALDIGVYGRWHRLVGIEAQYRYGTILLGGNFPYSGYAIGIRTALIPTYNQWWDELYLRAGVSRMAVVGTRDDAYTGVYLYPGWAVPLIGGLYIENELMLAHYFGTMAHLQVGFRTGIRWSL